MVKSQSNESPTVRFYDNYFKKKGFLDYSPDSIYVSEDQLRSLGLFKSDLFENRVVMEIGAGKGRYTRSLHRYGLLDNVKRYIVVEPTSHIETIRKSLPGKKFEYIRCTFDKIGKYIAQESIDTLLLIGVVPHIPISDLEIFFNAASRLLVPGGIVKVSSFYNGYDLSLSRRFRNARQKRFIPGSILALGQAVFQGLIYASGSAHLKHFYFRNFPYSFQKSLYQRYRHCFEYYMVDPYNIYWSYSDYIEAMQKSGLGLTHLEPHSLTLEARKGDALLTLKNLSTEKPVTVIGNDWLSRQVAAQLPKELQLKFHGLSHRVKGVDQIVVAYDYTQGPSYAVTVQPYLECGFRMGEDIFIYQMILPATPA